MAEIYTPNSTVADGSITATKIADGAVSVNYTAIIGTSWTGTTAPYTQTIAIPGMLATDTPFVDVLPSDTYATAEAQLDAWGSIYRIVANSNSITVYSQEATTVEIPIQLKVVRK